MTAVSSTEKSGFWQRRFILPIKQQLIQGVTPEKLALSCALGVLLGVFPILGTTTVLCFLAAYFLKLNQPAIQAVNYLIYPIQIILFPIFIRAGEILFSRPFMSFSIINLGQEFASHPWQFLLTYGVTGAHGIVVWIILSTLCLFPLYSLLKYAFISLERSIRLLKTKSHV